MGAGQRDGIFFAAVAKAAAAKPGGKDGELRKVGQEQGVVFLFGAAADDRKRFPGLVGVGDDGAAPLHDAAFFPGDGGEGIT